MLIQGQSRKANYKVHMLILQSRNTLYDWGWNLLYKLLPDQKESVVSSQLFVCEMNSMMTFEDLGIKQYPTPDCNFRNYVPYKM